MKLDKQPLNIDRTLLLAFLRSNTDLYEKNLESDFLNVLTDFIDKLPQEDTYQKGYNKGREDMKKEIRKEVKEMVSKIKLLPTLGLTEERQEGIQLTVKVVIMYIKESLLSPTDTK